MSRPGATPVLSSDAASAQRRAEERWTELFGCAPIRRPDGFAAQAVAWHEQAMEHGDVPLAIRRDLDAALTQVLAAREQKVAALEPHAPCEKLAGNDPELLAPCTNLPLPPASSQLLVGTRLVKSHGGKTHVVEVTDAGMLYEGELFSSLSAVAKKITGTHWNGLLFFGLRKRKTYERKKADG
ncbi:DUF2924 domain-containing protein [Sphingomonas ginkgonis]|uniref:DUF2924 domain-containing protein n=1 Tax=Sphingomonas ginkgonis TaxID=2315330 RepID=UPI00163A4613|nr:DUF2924 domain-containing protein [Sphingomonas ginkgonis]